MEISKSKFVPLSQNACRSISFNGGKSESSFRLLIIFVLRKGIVSWASFGLFFPCNEKFAFADKYQTSSAILAGKMRALLSLCNLSFWYLACSWQVPIQPKDIAPIESPWAISGSQKIDDADVRKDEFCLAFGVWNLYCQSKQYHFPYWDSSMDKISQLLVR